MERGRGEEGEEEWREGWGGRGEEGGSGSGGRGEGEPDASCDVSGWGGGGVQSWNSVSRTQKSLSSESTEAPKPCDSGEETSTAGPST